MNDRMKTDWEQAHALSDNLRYFVETVFPNVDRNEIKVSARPTDGLSDSFDVRVRASVGQGIRHDERNDNRLAVLSAIDEAAKFYATEINPKAGVNFV